MKLFLQFLGKPGEEEAPWDGSARIPCVGECIFVEPDQLWAIDDVVWDLKADSVSLILVELKI